MDNVASSIPTIPCSIEETIAKKPGLDVIINKHGVKKLAEEVVEFMLSDDKYTSCTFIRQLPELYPSFFDIRAGDWLFLLHTLNFSLRIPNSTKQWTVNNYTGFWALCAAIKRAIDNNKLIWNPNYYMTIASTEMKYIFRGDDEIILPYLEERRIILHHVGKILKKKYGGLFINCIKKSKYDADKLTKMLFEFESYQDEVTFHGKPIRLCTKAKLLISDLRTYFPISSKSSMKMSTLLIDYRATQVLLHFEAIRYTERLQLLLTDGIMLRYGDTEELQIRCCLIYAVQMVCDEVRKMCAEYKGRMTAQNIRISHISTIVDNFIFHYQMKHSDHLMETVPFHYIRSTMY